MLPRLYFDRLTIPHLDELFQVIDEEVAWAVVHSPRVNQLSFMGAFRRFREPLRQRARVLGQQLSAEDGAGMACDRIDAVLAGRPHG